MAKYCNEGGKAQVNFTFGDGSGDKYITQNSPIEVSILEGEQTIVRYGTSAFIPDGITRQVYLYGKYFTAPNYPNCPFDLDFMVLIGIATGPITLNVVTTEANAGCTGSQWNDIPAINHIDRTRQWGEQARIGLAENQCKIKIVDSKLKVFEKMGQCPVKYTVECNNQCPPNHIRCECDSYPGYCCIPCNEVLGELRSIKEGLKNG